jgi:hypothetical protein
MPTEVNRLIDGSYCVDDGVVKPNLKGSSSGKESCDNPRVSPVTDLTLMAQREGET